MGEVKVFRGLVALMIATLIVAGPAPRSSAKDPEKKTTLSEPMTAEEPASGEDLQVDDVTGLDPDGGTVILDEGLATEETLSYTSIDEETNELIRVSRLDPVAHEEGAMVQTSSTSTTVGEDRGPQVTLSPSFDGKDVLYVSDGLNIISTSTYALGTLATGGTANSTPQPSNLTKLQTVCLEIRNSAYTEGRHCFHVYKPSNPDGDSTYDYRVGWWTGSSHAKCCNDLTRVRDWAWEPSDAPAYQSTTTWSPNGTTNPSSCATRTISLGVSHGGANASVSSSFNKCPDSFGPESITSDRFYFAWVGGVDNATWIGTSGGYEWKYKPSLGWKVNINFYNRYCTPDWLC